MHETLNKFYQIHTWLRSCLFRRELWISLLHSYWVGKICSSCYPFCYCTLYTHENFSFIWKSFLVWTEKIECIVLFIINMIIRIIMRQFHCVFEGVDYVIHRKPKLVVANLWEKLELFVLKKIYSQRWTMCNKNIKKGKRKEQKKEKPLGKGVLNYAVLRCIQ